MYELGNLLKTEKFRIMIPVFVIVLIGIICYSNSINGKFICDDAYLIQNNDLIKTFDGVSDLFKGEISTSSGLSKFNFYRPVQMITYSFDHFFWRLNETGYHITNIILHIFTAFALFWLILILSKDRVISFITSILFLIHPVQTEAVSYISGRSDSLAAVFSILCLIFYVKYSLNGRSRLFYFFSLFLYAIAILSRENSIFIILLIALLDRLYRKEYKWGQMSPFFAIAMIYVLFRVFILNVQISNSYIDTTFLSRLPGFFMAVVEYIKLLIVPVNLHMDYGIDLFEWKTPEVLSGVLVLCGMFFYFIWSVKKQQKLIALSIGWFLIMIIPISNLYPLNSFMAEHWLYLPSIGLFLLAGLSFRELFNSRYSKIPVVIIFIFVVIYFSHKTIIQNNYWENSEVFYERTLKFSPDSLLSMNNLGNVYYRKGKTKEAILMFKRAIKTNSRHAESYNNLGNVYRKTGSVKNAVSMYKKALTLNPDSPEIYNNLANCNNDLGNRQKVIEFYKKSIGLDPCFASAYQNLAITYYYQKKYDLAIECFDESERLGFNGSVKLKNLLRQYRKNE